jgi:Ni,Fe-hydrogenase maturation factor
MKKKTVYITGNPLVKEDSIPLRMMGRLREKFPGIEFCELDPTDNFPEEKTLRIIDTVIGIDDVSVIRDVDKIVTGKVYSLHDFDLGFNLKLMKKAGKLRSIHIIGVPAHFDEEKAFRGVSKALRNM